MYDIIIAGGGPAGMTAAIYARRSGKSVLLLEREGYGGQIAYAPRVENYPGVASVGGAELAERMLEQMLALDAETDVARFCPWSAPGRISPCAPRTAYTKAAP